jgi:hypothetical protein
MAKRKRKMSEAAERNQAYEARKREAGWSRIWVWLAPGVDRNKVKSYVERQNRGAARG